jgi:hypothetical protein
MSPKVLTAGKSRTLPHLALLLKCGCHVNVGIGSEGDKFIMDVGWDGKHDCRRHRNVGAPDLRQMLPLKVVNFDFHPPHKAETMA